MKEPLISIIVPVFNIEDYIAECIESIRKQTCHNLQIILVDDGSSDNSGKICDAYAQTDRRIEVIHQNNGGLVSARKSGLKAAKGQYIGFVDGDDYIEEEMYRRLMEEAERTGADLVHSGYWENARKRVPDKKKDISLPSDKKRMLEAVLLAPEAYGISYSIWSKLFRAELIKKSYMRVPNQCSYGEDVINLCICLLECENIVLLEEAFYCYRIRKDSLSHENNVDTLKNIFKLYEGLRDVLHPYDCGDEQILNRFLWNEVYKCMGRISRSDFRIAIYHYSDMEQLRGKKVVIYGAGQVGKDYFAQISRYKECEIAAWIDSHPEKYCYPYVEVGTQECLAQTKFDMILIAVENENTAQEIRGQLIRMGIDSGKIYWSKPLVYDAENRG